MCIIRVSNVVYYDMEAFGRFALICGVCIFCGNGCLYEGFDEDFVKYANKVKETENSLFGLPDHSKSTLASLAGSTTKIGAKINSFEPKGGLDKENKDVLNIDDDKIESIVNKILGKKVGLRNIGSTCYMNTTLQILFHTPEFVRTLFNYRKEGKIDKEKTPLTYSLYGLLLQYSNSDVPIGPNMFKGCFANKFPDFSSGQHDSIEFLRILFGHIENEIGKENFKNLIGLFFSDLVSTTKRKCGHSTYGSTLTLDIPLLFPDDDKKAIKITDLLNDYFAEREEEACNLDCGECEEELIWECDECTKEYINKIKKCGGTISDCKCRNCGKPIHDRCRHCEDILDYKCEECSGKAGKSPNCECKNGGKCSMCGRDISNKSKKKVVIGGSTKKSESMIVAPEYIVLSLQRFKKVDQKDEGKGYLNKKYFIDIENLANVRMCICGENVNYELCAIAVKEGQPGSGHYYAYVKLSDGKFYNFDDSKPVVEVDIKNASKTAYVLFYKKKVS